MFNPTYYDSEKKVWSVPKAECIFNKDISIGHVVLFMMRSRSPDSICQILESENTALTWQQVSDYAVLIAEHLKGLGLTEKDVVGIVSPNTTLLYPTVIGCWLNCTPHHGVDPQFDEDTIRHLYGITKPKVIFCDGKCYEKIQSATKELGNIKFYTLCNHIEGVSTVEDIFKAIEKPVDFIPVALKYGSNQTMAIFCTSGTTGLPKCVPFPNYDFFKGPSGDLSSEIIYTTSAVHWVSYIINMLFNALNGARMIATNETPTPEHALQILKKHNVSTVFTIPGVIVRYSNLDGFTKTNLPNLIQIVMMGASIGGEALQRLRKKLHPVMIYTGYGMTEIGGIAHNIGYAGTNVLGQLANGILLKIVDPETRKPLDYNQEGEICVRFADEIWPGYLDDEKATKDVLDDEGFLHTGDKGFMDQTDVLHFCDRYKDIMKYNGYQFSPTQIEQTISELSDAVDVCVFGVHDDNFGDLAAAAVVRRSSYNLNEDDIIEYVAKRQKSKCNQLNYGVFFVDKIERNTNGKVLRNYMRDICLNQVQIKNIYPALIECKCSFSSMPQNTYYDHSTHLCNFLEQTYVCIT